MKERICPNCGEKLPEGRVSWLVYCCDECRREYQNRRRREERAERKALMDAERASLDPWIRNDTDDVPPEEMLMHTLVDPVPCLDPCADDGGGIRKKKRCRGAWKARWMRLL